MRIVLKPKTTLYNDALFITELKKNLSLSNIKKLWDIVRCYAKLLLFDSMWYYANGIVYLPPPQTEDFFTGKSFCNNPPRRACEI